MAEALQPLAALAARLGGVTPRTARAHLLAAMQRDPDLRVVLRGRTILLSEEAIQRTIRASEWQSTTAGAAKSGTRAAPSASGASARGKNRWFWRRFWVDGRSLAPSVKPHRRGFCRHCGRLGELTANPGPRQLTFDHIVPKGRRGLAPRDLREQGWPACGECNQLRSALWHCPALVALCGLLAAETHQEPWAVARGWLRDARKIALDGSSAMT